MLKRFLCILLSLMLAAGMAAALAEEPAADTEAAVQQETAAEAEASSEAEAADEEEPVLLVTVNGEEIMSDDGELNYWIGYYIYQLANSGYDTSDAALLNMINQYSLLNTMRYVLISQKAAELGLDQLSDKEKASMEAEARSGWEQAVAAYTQDVTDESTDDEKAAARADAIAALKNDGYEEETYISEYVESETTNLLINRLMDYVSADITVEDDEVQTYFNELVEEDKASYGDDISNYEFYTQYYQQPSYYTPEGYRGINHILLKVDETLLNTWKDLTARFEEQKSETPEETTEPVESAEGEAAEGEAASTPEPTAEPVTEEMVEAAKQAILDSVQPTVDEIMAKLKDGVSFDDLILEYGTDQGMQDEATRKAGYSVHKDSIIWDPAFTAGAVALEKIGDVSEPIVGQYGVHILHYLRDIPAGAVELTDEMKAEFRDSLLDQKKNAALSAALDQWMEESETVYTEAGEAWKLTEEAEQTDEAEPEAEEEAAAEPAAEAAPEAEATPAAEAVPAE